MTPPTTWLGVCGWPVAHSRSPDIQNAALAAAGLAGWRYLKLPLPPELFEETVRALPARGFRGVNVTIPHKVAALHLADTATDRAREIGAANTLVFDPATGAVHADNTDAPGLLASLPEAHRPRPGSSAFVLGAGGAARAAVYALVQAGATVAVWNRTPERARALADELGAVAVEGRHRAHLVVDCTSVGLRDDPAAFKRLPLDADDVGAGSCVVDMAYRPGGGTLLQRAARAWGADVVDGLEVLIGQGAESFEQWTGRPADRQAMRKAVAPIA